MIVSSIRTRLISSVAAIQLVGAGLAVYLVVAHERRQAYVAFDASLGEQAAAVRSLVEAPEEKDEAIIFHQEFLALPESDRFLITDVHGGMIGSSRISPSISFLPRETRSVVQTIIQGTAYRALILRQLVVIDQEAEPTSNSPTITLIYASPIAPVEEHIRRVELQAIEACFALLATTMLISAWALTRSLRPLHRLARDAQKIDVGHWTLSELEKSRECTELRPLANALAELIDRLRYAFDRERQFFGDAAHEMKTSVAIVRSTLQSALQTDRSASEYKRELQGAFADTVRLQDLVASMLNLARIESTVKRCAATIDTAIEVHAEIQQVINRLWLIATRKEIQMEITSDHGELWIAMPEEDFVTILSNLVENAIVYSDFGTRIHIAIRRNCDRCEIAVRDEGCGIQESALPFIFDRFYRGDASRARLTGGVGLGLSIVKALVTKANGTIGVQSEYGRGTTFEIILPCLYATLG